MTVVNQNINSNFEYYHKNVILPNKYPYGLSDPFIVDIDFSPPSIVSKFICLEKFILDNISTKYIKNALAHSFFLSELHLISY